MARSGFPLSDYRRSWESLRQIQPGPEVGSDSSEVSRTGGTWNSSQLHGIVRSKASAYMQSFPGSDQTGSNHIRFRALIANKKRFEIARLRYLSDVLDYRMEMLDLATQFARYMGLEGPTAVEANPGAWFEVQSKGLFDKNTANAVKAQGTLDK